MSRKKAKTKVNVEEVFRARLVLRALNKLKLEDVEFVDDNGNPVKKSNGPWWSETTFADGTVKKEKHPPLTLEEFNFVGLSNWEWVIIAYAGSFGKKYTKLRR